MVQAQATQGQPLAVVAEAAIAVITTCSTKQRQWLPNDAWARSDVYTLASSTYNVVHVQCVALVLTRFKFFDAIEDADGNTNSNFHLPAKGLITSFP